jgi:hypothetical protein
MFYNESLKEFIKSFLGSVQKHGNVSSEVADEGSEINKDKFKLIIKLILLLFWRLVSNNAVSLMYLFI